MQANFRTKQIGAHTYQVSFVSPMTALGLEPALARALVPALAGLAQMKKQGGTKILERDVSVLAGLIGEALSVIDEETLARFVRAMRPVSVVIGGTADNPGGRLDQDAFFDVHFMGKPALLLRWLVFAIEVNFGDFFDTLRASLAGAQASAAGEGAEQSKSRSPST